MGLREASVLSRERSVEAAAILWVTVVTVCVVVATILRPWAEEAGAHAAVQDNRNPRGRLLRHLLGTRNYRTIRE